jgi:CO/xanthine dehydrogenase Mo-binding subunit
MAKHRGRGLATIEYPTGMNQSGDLTQSWIKLKHDGSVDVISGTVDIGNGSKTAHRQIVAAALGVPVESVTVDVSDTDSSPWCTGTFASRCTYIAGNAVRLAAEEVRERVLEIAGKMLEADPHDLTIEDGVVFAEGAPETNVSVADVANAATWEYGGELLAGKGTFVKPFAKILDHETGRIDRDPHAALSYGASLAEVEVDDETGEVTVLRFTEAYDIGYAINPTIVEGQIQGGTMMGLGLALLEASYPYYPSPEHRGPDFASYPSPSMVDMPEIDFLCLENPSAEGPFGAKACGEMANNGQGPSVAAAIYDAVGVWVTELPLTPERVLRALEKKAAGEDAPRVEGKWVIFDDDISINTVGAPDGEVKFEMDGS